MSFVTMAVSASVHEVVVRASAIHASRKGKQMTLLDVLIAKPPPLRVDGQGAVRIGKTRVTLDTVVGAFKSGCTIEDILRKYPSLEMTDAYAAITYYLWHPGEVEAYMEQRRRQAEELRRRNEPHSPPPGLSERLLARRPVNTRE
jgi:uncharacterized protein (DUF433 family)